MTTEAKQRLARHLLEDVEEMSRHTTYRINPASRAWTARLYAVEDASWEYLCGIVPPDTTTR